METFYLILVCDRATINMVLKKVVWMMNIYYYRTKVGQNVDKSFSVCRRYGFVEGRYEHSEKLTYKSYVEVAKKKTGLSY